MTVPDEPANPWSGPAATPAGQAPVAYPQAPPYPQQYPPAPQYGSAPPPYGYGAPPQYGMAYAYAPQAPGTNGMAIASLVCSLFGFLYGITAILAIVFGFVARSQIKQRPQSGKGLALAGIIVGIGWFVVFFAGIALAIALEPSSFD